MEEFFCIVVGTEIGELLAGYGYFFQEILIQLENGREDVGFRACFDLVASVC
jgi:hypothetical protein